MKNSTKLCTLTLFFVCTTILAQQDTLKINRNAKGIITFVKFVPSNSREMSHGNVFLKEILKAGQNDNFRLQKESVDKYGITHHRYQQYYTGIKVEGSEYLIHGKKGKIETINGNYIKIDNLSTSPQLTEQQALKNALTYIGAELYKWEDKGMESYIKENTGNPNATYFPEGELIITQDVKVNKGEWKLAWKFTISSLVPNNEQLIYIDAQSGGVIGETPLILDANTPSIAQTMYSGNQNIISDSFSGGFRLWEVRSGVNIRTVDLQNSTNLSNAIDFINTNTNWTNGNWTSFSQHQQALDAHWGAEQVFNYWNTVHGRNSIDNNGINIVSYVHYDINEDNAFWDSNNHVMYYGDGNIFNPLVALDICAHEFGHGINQFEANLGSSPGWNESDALNEGLSDIWGAVIENWSTSDKSTWLMGEDLFGNGSGFNCIRNLQNPKSINSAEGQHPDTYQGDYWRTDGEPHFNSNVISHWFYLISEGSSSTDEINDNGDSFSVDGIGIDTAAEITYQAQINYLTSSSNYSAARTAMINAAIDIFGDNTCQVKSVTDAWHAVGLGQAYTSTPYISGSNSFCLSASYTLNNAPTNTSINWSITPSGVANLVPSGNSVTVNKSGGGSATLKATYEACGSEVVLSKKISTTAKVVSISAEYNGCYNGYATWYLTATPNFSGATNWQWTVDNPGSGSWYIDQPNSRSTWVEVNGGGGISVTYQSPCGGTSQPNGTTIYSSCTFTFNASMYPNPVIGKTVTIEMPQSKNDYASFSLTKNIKRNEMYIREIEIYDFYGQLKLNQVFKDNFSNLVKINVSNFQKGIYFVKLSDGIHRETLRLIVE